MLISVLIAFSLNFDTFSVAIVSGAESKNNTIKKAFKVGLCFGFCQGLMALIGSILGIGFRAIIINIDHWVAFVLLGIIGGKIIFESENNKKDKMKINFINFRSLILLAIATSIDALIIGITLPFLKESVIINILIIFLITFLVSFMGFYGGKKLRLVFKNKTKIFGGSILILIGLKILIEHILFS